MNTAPVMHGQAVRADARLRDSRRLLMERGAVLLRRFFRILSRGWTQWRKQAGRNLRAANGGRLGAVLGRTLTAKGGRGRMLAVEERLTLGPKQHMYLIRCGEQRLLVASAGEGALQWMALPGEDLPERAEACENTLPAKVRSKSGTKRSTAKPRSGTRGTKRAAAGASAAEGRR